MTLIQTVGANTTALGSSTTQTTSQAYSFITTSTSTSTSSSYSPDLVTIIPTHLRRYKGLNLTIGPNDLRGSLSANNIVIMRV